MANDLPHIRQDLVANNKATGPFYLWFGRIQTALNAGTLATDAVSAAIRTIATVLGSPDGTAENIPALAFLRTTTYVRNGAGIGVSGTLAGGGVEVSLDAVLADLNDVGAAVPSAGDALVWGGSEWAPGSVASGVPYEVADGAAYAVPAGIQSLWTIPIDLLGASYLDLSGALVEVN